MKITKHILLMAFLATGLTACNDDDDDYVPVGGEIINYNVTIGPNAWEYFEDDFGTVGVQTDFEVPDLTEDIQEYGAVLVYLDYGNGVYEALPQVYDDVSVLYNTFPYSLQIQMTGINNIEIDPPGADVYCKIVMLEATVVEAHPNVDLQKMTLSEVERTFGVR